MGEVIPFPQPRASSYGPHAIEMLKNLGPVRGEQLTYLGACDMPQADVEQLARILYEQRGLRAIRVLGEQGQDLIIFRGQLPSFRTY